MKGLFLDDERNPQDITWLPYPANITWTIVRTYAEFCNAPLTQDFGIISFDHDIQDYDLKGNERTGYDCMKYLVEMALDEAIILPLCVVHSQNPTGAENIRKYYENACKYLENNV